MKNQRLWGMRCYLSGAMDLTKDSGAGWRNEFTPFLEKLGVIVLNPADKKIYGGETFPIEDLEYRKKLKENCEFDQFQKEIKPLRLVDLRMVGVSDFIIIRLDKKQLACGTFDELSIANKAKKPILLYFEQGKKEAYDWLFGMIPHEHIFGNWQDLQNYLLYVHTAEVVETYKRWIFLDYSQLMPKVSYG